MPVKGRFEDKESALYIPTNVADTQLLLARVPELELSQNNILALSRLLLAGSAAGILFVFNYSGTLVELKKFAKGVPAAISSGLEWLCVVLISSAVIAFIVNFCASAALEAISSMRAAALTGNQPVFAYARKNYIGLLVAASLLFALNSLLFLVSMILAVVALSEVLSAN